MLSLPRLPALGVALLAAMVVASPASAATLSLTPSAPLVLDTPNDGVVAPGDTLSITETVTNGGADATGLQATLTPLTPGVQVVAGTGASSYPDIVSGGTGANTTPFKVTVDQSLACGTILNFSLSFTSTGGNTGTVHFSVTTGGATALQDHAGAHTLIGDATPTLRPHLAAATTSYSAAALVSTAGIVKGVQVEIGSLTHDYIGHLKLSIVAPDGTRATLVDHRGGASHTFTDTELVPSSPNSLASGSAPYTGTFQADGDLGALVGVNQQGTWHLLIDADDPLELGSVDSWTLRISTADCSAQSYPKLQVPALAAAGPVTLDASGSRSVAAGGITKYEWDLGDGSFSQTTTPPNDTLTATFARGHYTVRVKVSDSRGPIGIATATLIVSQAPVAVIAPIGSPKQGQNVTLDGSASYDPDGPALTNYEWDLDYDGSNFSVDATGSGPTVAFATAGSHTVALRATDVDGATTIATQTINVVAAFAPMAAVTANPNPVVAGSPVTFDASGSSDSDGTVVSYAWDLDGNGTFETSTGGSPMASRSYLNPGVVSVGVRVTDDDAKTGVTHLAVAVRAAAGGATPTGSSGSATGTGTASGGGSGAGGGSGSGGGEAGAALAAALAGSPIQTLKLVTKKGLGLRCSADRAVTCSVVASLKGADARRLRLSRSAKKAFVIGRASVRLKKAGASTVTIRVTRTVLAKLKRMPRVRVLVTGTATDAGGSRASLSRTILLRR